MSASASSNSPFLCAAVVLCWTVVAGAQVKFTDVTVQCGLSAELYDADTNHGLGSAWIDVNKDGWPDLFCVNGKSREPHLYLNNTNGTMSRRDDLLPTLPDVEMPAAVFADYDNDGDSDLYIIADHETQELAAVSGPNPQDGPPNMLLRNMWVELGKQFPPAGQPLFQEVAAAAGVDDLPPTPFFSVTGTNYKGYRAITASWLDYDRDGYVDLYVGHWSTQHQYTTACWDRLFHNKGDGTFEDVTAAVGLPGPNDLSKMRPNLVSIGCHLDQDLWPDMYWGNVQGDAQLQDQTIHQDAYWRNSGKGTFVDATKDSAGLGDDGEACMGIAVGDVDNDGDWDFYMTDVFNTFSDALPLGNTFYKNNGDGTFQDNAAVTAGVAGDTSWPAVMLDVNHDGFQDIFIGVAGPNAGNNILWRNTSNGGFTNISASANVGAPGKGARGASVADFDRDGDLDILVNYDNGATMQLLRNDSSANLNWLAVDLKATVSNRDAIGAVIKVKAGNVRMMHQLFGGNSAHSQNGLTANFGLGAATKADTIDVFWPSGLVTHMDNVAANQFVSITESPQKIQAFGEACSGGGAYAPSLVVGGNAAPGGTLQINVASGHGSGDVFFVFGQSANPGSTVAGCPLHLQGALWSLYAGKLTGSADGRGNLSLPFTIPVSTAMGTAAFQAWVTNPTVPVTISATNAVEAKVSP